MDDHSTPTSRAERIAGMVARVIAGAAHDAILQDNLAGTKAGQWVIADALLEFARILANNHTRGVGNIIEAAKLARNASEIIRMGGACITLLIFA